MRRISIFFLCTLMLLCMAAPVLAVDSNVRFEGEADGFIFQPGSQESVTDLFPELKNVMPGDQLTQIITVHNKSDMEVKIYLKGLGAEEGSEKMLSQLTLCVQQNSSVLFDAPADQTAQLSDWICLGTFAPGQKTDLTVTLEVPIEMGNEFQNQAGYLNWVFRVDEIPTETTTEATQPDQPKPTEPGTDIPETGDEMLLWPTIILMIGSGCMMCWLASKRKYA